MELPPRARRIREAESAGVAVSGTTSACAENTGHRSCCNSISWNYLRVRGEYISQHTNLASCQELPPRARRILIAIIGELIGAGTTSACAENTIEGGAHSLNTGNYLRVRGEYPTAAHQHACRWELPPRARRILVGWVRLRRKLGTTSACAENTLNELGLL